MYTTPPSAVLDAVYTFASSTVQLPSTKSPSHTSPNVHCRLSGVTPAQATAIPSPRLTTGFLRKENRSGCLEPVGPTFTLAHGIVTISLDENRKDLTRRTQCIRQTLHRGQCQPTSTATLPVPPVPPVPPVLPLAQRVFEAQKA